MAFLRTAAAIALVASILSPADALVPRVSISNGCDSFDASCAMTLTEGMDQTVQINLDEPIICSSQDVECVVVVNFSNSHPHIVQVNPCLVRFDRSDWHQTKTVQVTAVQSYQETGVEQRVHIETHTVASAEYYRGFDPLDLFIKSENRRTAGCSANGDPHIRTLDGKYWHFYDGTSRNPSRVTLLRADNRDFIIQNQLRGNPARNCAMAGREGPDRVIINSCGNQVQLITDFNHPDSSKHPRVQVSGRTYTVYFHSGAWMQASASRGYVGVFVQSVDYMHSCGICGNFNGVASDDSPGSSVAWARANSYGALFPCQKVPSVLSGRPAEDGGDIWQWTYNAANFPNLGVVVPLPQSNCPYEIERIIRPVLNPDDIVDITDQLEELADQIRNQTEGGNFEWDDENNDVVEITQFDPALSLQTCGEAINASLTVVTCAARYPEFAARVHNYTQDCAIDYSEMGGPESELAVTFLEGTVRSMRQDCLEIAISLGDTTNTTLLQALCQNACSNQGICNQEARCECNTGFAGVDCSVDLNSPPNIVHVSDLVFDTAGHQSPPLSPSEILVSGTNFLMSNGTRCRFGTIVTNGFFVGPTQIICQVPTFNRTNVHSGAIPLDMNLSVSNDGVRWSINGDRFAFRFFDSTCLRCNYLGECSQNPTSCVIGSGENAQCFLPDATDPDADNICLECQPAISNSSMSYIYRNRLCRPQFTSTIYQYSIIGSATAGQSLLRVDATANPLVANNPNGYPITYEYIHNEGDGFAPQMFNVDANTGEISIINAISIDDAQFGGLAHAAQNPTIFNGFFNIRATDSQNNTVTTSVNIELLPLGFTPIFPEDGYHANVAENATTGSPVSVNATNDLMIVAQNLDIDGIDPDSVEYRWHSEPGIYAGALSIDISTGAVTVNDSTKLNYEAPEDTVHYVNHTLHYQARATDNLNGFLFVIVDVYVTLTDVPEAPTGVFVNDSTSVFVNENYNGTLGNLSTVDPEGGSFTYSIVSNSPQFEIATTSDGVSFLNLIADIDFEAPASNTIIVNIRSTDSTGLFKDQPITILVVDIDEAPHSVSISAIANSGVTVNGNTITLSEATPLLTDIVSVTAVDPENRPIRCYLPDIALKIRPSPNCDSQTTAQSVNNIIVWNSALDFETRPTASQFIVCEDCAGHESELFQVSIVVLDANEAPTMTNWANVQTAPVTEGSTRAGPTVIGTITIQDDAGSSTPLITPSNESMFSVSALSCPAVPSGQPIVCTADVSLLASAVVSYEQFAGSMPAGQYAISLLLSDAVGQLPSQEAVEVVVSMNVEDVPEPPTGVTLSASSITEDPEVGQLVCSITINDEDVGSIGNYNVEVTTNPDNAFTIAPAEGRRRQTTGGAEWSLTVNNPAAFDYETLSSGGLPGSLSFTILITDNSIPVGSPRTLSVTESISVTDAPMSIITNTSDISGIQGLFGARFSLANFDQPEIASSITWSITNNPGSVPVLNTWGQQSSSTGSFTDLAVNSDTLLNHPDDTVTVNVQATLPAPYGVIVGQFSLRIADVQLPPVLTESNYDISMPYFTSVPRSVVDVSAVDPDISAIGQRMELFVGRLVASPSVNLLETPDIVTVYQVPLGDSYTNRFVTSQAYIVQHDMSMYNAFHVERVSTLDRCNLVEEDEQELFSCDIKVLELPTNLPVTEVAGIVNTTGLFNIGGLFVVAVKDSQSNGEDMELAAFAPLEITYEAQTTTALTIIFAGGSAGGENDSSSSVGLIIGIVILLLLILLVAAAVYFYQQQKLHKARDMFDGKETGMSTNPAYTGSQPVPYEQTPFVPGISNPLYDWYQPKMTRKDCTDHLMTQGEGAFVVRDSDSNPGWHMIGVKSANEILHEKIRQTENGEYQLLPSRGAAAETAQPTFASLPELVDYYLKEHPGMPYTLAASNPIYDNHQLAQERTGQLQAAKYDEALPSKNHEYADANGYASTATGEKHGGDSVGNPMYFASGAVAPQNGTYAAPYLDVNPNAPNGGQTAGYLDINPDEEEPAMANGQGYSDVPSGTTYGVPTSPAATTGYQAIPSIDSIAVDPNAMSAI